MSSIQEKIKAVRKGKLAEVVNGSDDEHHDDEFFIERIQVALSTIYTDYMNEHVVADAENGPSSSEPEEVMEALKGFCLLVKSVVKNPSAFHKATRVASRKHAATKIIGKAMSKV